MNLQTLTLSSNLLTSPSLSLSLRHTHTHKHTTIHSPSLLLSLYIYLYRSLSLSHTHTQVNLQTLTLSSNLLTSLPPDLVAMTSLEEVWLDDNQLGPPPALTIRPID